MAEEYDYLFKSIVVGDGGVGKTALTLRFSKGFFTEDYKMTIGVDFHVKTISINTLEETIKCKLQLWDTGGQERFSSIRPMYYRGALGAVLVFDLTNYTSFEHLPQWIEEVRDNIKSEIPLLLVGNKNDLAEQRTVSIEEINNFTRDFNLYYIETSAKTGDGVGDCFYILACLMIGSGVPEQLIKNQTVYSPGRVTLEVSSVLVKEVSPPEPEIDYAAPPIPEPPSIRIGEEKFIHDIFKSSPEMDYAVPPVSSPPSLSIEKPINHGVEPERNLPKPSEIENEPIVNRIYENYLLIKLLKEKDTEIEQLKLEYELLNQELRSVKPSFESQSEENLGNKERILNLLKSEHLTSNEIAEKLSLSKQDTRTYLQRLKAEDKLKVIDKKGRFLVYALKKPLSSAKEHYVSESLEYELSYLLNLMEMKMTPKDGVKFAPVDLMHIKKIEKRIADKKWRNKEEIKVLREFIDFEKTYKQEIDEKLAELEAKVNYITSGVELQQEKKEAFKQSFDNLLLTPLKVENDLKIHKLSPSYLSFSQPSLRSSSQSFVNHMPHTILSKKELAKKNKNSLEYEVSEQAKTDSFSVEDEIIYLKNESEYVKFLGITSKERTPLFNNNHRYNYLLELTNNLDYIATSILGGELDKMLLITSNNIEEKCHFYIKDNLIYIVYGVFPDKKGKWMLEQMAKYFSELVHGKDINNLSKLEKRNINHKFIGLLNFMLNEYLGLQEVFTDQEIPYLEDWIRVDYLGLSSMSIGVISLLLDEQGNLNVDVPGEYDNPAEEIEMKESLLAAKIEAIAANTLGNTGSYPRWIAVKLGFQKYRFLTFKRYQNDYFLSFLSEGNLKKIELVEKKIDPYLYHGIDTPFAGNLRPFNKLKASVKNVINHVPERKFI